MTPREGRLHGWHESQAGAILYRHRASGVTEFLLVTSKRDRWILPKGGVEAGDSAAATATRECEEEAGVRGTPRESPFASWRRRHRGHERRVTYFLLAFEADCALWKERHRRRRAWLPLADALERLEEPALRELLAAAHELLARER